jgi:hypothetical protein
MEERVRDAFGAAAETVTAQDLPGPPTPADRGRAAVSRRDGHRRARMRALLPAAAAAGVVVIVATLTLVVPRLLAGPPAGRTGGGLAGAPRFFAGVSDTGRGSPRTTVVNIYRSATGRVVASFRPPSPDHDFTAVARIGSDQAYVAAAITSFHDACTTQLYQFTVGPAGRPSRLTPLSVPHVAGAVGELVGSADGNVLAYTASPGRCAPRGRPRVGVIHLVTRHVTTWSYGSGNRRPVIFGSLSLNADGSLLGFTGGALESSNVWILPTTSPPGPLTRHARRVMRLRTGVFRVVLDNTGSLAYVETESRPRGGAVVVGLYDTATGKLIRLVGRLGPGGRQLAEVSVSLDAAGQHLLAYGYLNSPQVAEMNLTTGHLITVRVTRPPYLDAAYSTAAW